MIGTVLFILAVIGIVYLVTKRNKKSNSTGGSSTGNPPVIKDPDSNDPRPDQPEEIN